MKFHKKFGWGIYNQSGEDTQYFGNDAREFLKSINWNDIIDNIGRDCLTSKQDCGTIIGIEDSQCYLDIYYIIFVPSLEELQFELVNNRDFYIEK